MKCSYLTLSQYVDSELDPIKKGEVDAHLVGCQRCSTALEQLSSEVRRMHGLSHVRVDDAATKSLLTRLHVLALEEPLPTLQALHKGDMGHNDALPWLRTGVGTALPWSPGERTLHTSEQGTIPRPEAESFVSPDQLEDPSAPPVPSSSPSPVVEGSPAGILSTDPEGTGTSGHERENGEVTGNFLPALPSVPPLPNDLPVSEWSAMHHPVDGITPVDHQGELTVDPTVQPNERSTREIYTAKGTSAQQQLYEMDQDMTSDGVTPPNPARISALHAGSQSRTMSHVDEAKNTHFLVEKSPDEPFRPSNSAEANVWEEAPLPPAVPVWNVRGQFARWMNLRQQMHQGHDIEVVSGVGAPKVYAHHMKNIALDAMHGIELKVSHMRTAKAPHEFLPLEENEDDAPNVPPMEELPITMYGDRVKPVATPSISPTIHPERLPILQDVDIEDSDDSALPKRGHFDTWATDTPDPWDEPKETPKRPGRHVQSVDRTRTARRIPPHSRPTFSVPKMSRPKLPAGQPLDRRVQIVAGMVLGLIILSLAIHGVMTHRVSTPSPTHAVASATPQKHLAPSISSSSTPKTEALTNVQSFGAGGTGVQVEDLRYAQHVGYYRVVLDCTGSVLPSGLVGITTDGSTVVVVLKDTAPQGQPNTLSEATTISSVHMLSPTTKVNETVYQFHLAQPVTVQYSYLPNPTRLIFDFYPKA